MLLVNTLSGLEGGASGAEGHTSNSEVPGQGTFRPTMGHYRWWICLLLFLAASINYIDRQVFGILAPGLQDEFGWSEIQYSNIIAAFQFAYAIGMVLVGRWIDRWGTRLGLALVVLFWSLAGMAHALASSVLGFAAARFLLGFWEAGSFPATIKTIAEWFPKRERALATGMVIAGTNVGAIITPLTVPWITINYGWPAAFLMTGAVGIVWSCLWIPLYHPPEQHPRLSSVELTYIGADPAEPATSFSWISLLTYKQTWAFAVGKFLTDPIWWFYLYWLPKFLNSTHGITIDKVALPLLIIYLASDAGSVLGGWLSSTLIKRGWSINWAWKTVMLICAISVIPIVFAARCESLPWVLIFVGFAAAGHQGWSANLFTLTSDMFPRHTLGSVVGIGGMAGAIGGIIVAKVAGYTLQATGTYFPLLILASSTYLVAWALIQWLTPKLEPVDFV